MPGATKPEGRQGSTETALPRRAGRAERAPLPGEFQSLTGADPMSRPTPPRVPVRPKPSPTTSHHEAGGEQAETPPATTARAPEPEAPAEPTVPTVQIVTLPSIDPPVVTEPVARPAAVRAVPVTPPADAGRETAPRPPRGRRTGLVAALVVTVVLLAAAVALVWRPGSDGAPAGAAKPTAAAASGVDTSSGVQAPLLLADDAEYVETRVLDGGDLLVTHWIHTTRPTNVVTVDVPTTPGLAGQTVGVTHLVVAADGEQVEAPDTVDVQAGWAGPLSAAHDVYVQYELSGVLQTGGSVQGRALAPLTSLDVGVGRPLSQSQTFPGIQILSLACLAPGAQAMPRPCGTLEDDAWTVTSALGSAGETVIAQLEVPAP